MGRITEQKNIENLSVIPPFPWQQTKMAAKYSLVWKHCNSSNHSCINAILSVSYLQHLLWNHECIAIT